MTLARRHYVGVDLAWGENRPTGLAVLDSLGILRHVSAATDDASIIDALKDYTRGPCVVAIDAPLVVVNATGNRPAEAALNKDFRRYEAGAHPSNTAKPEFAQTPRAARLAATLDLDIDPGSSADRRALEVYPHPATIVLFGLDRTLKYKAKPGRTVDDLRAALLRLMGLIESLGDAPNPMVVTDYDAWLSLRAHVEQAQRKSQLRRAEDQVDAVVCAYVALLADLTPQNMTTYGDLATGYIVTPSLNGSTPGSPTSRGQAIAQRASTGQGPTKTTRDKSPATQQIAGPRAIDPDEATPSPRDSARAAVRAYEHRRPEVVAATDAYADLVTGMLDDAGINYLSVTGRTKSVASFAEKAQRRDDSLDGDLLFPDPATQITDQIGIRVITFVHSDVAAVADLLAAQMTVLDDRDMGQETAREGRFGYASRHVLVAADADAVSVKGHRASVQVRTVLQHAWAEFEHDIRYKGTVPTEHVPDLDRRFTLAAGLLELADREFSTIRDRLQETMSGRPSAPDDDDPRISAQDLASFLAGRFADAGWSRSEHYAWISGLLLELDVTSLDELGALLAAVDLQVVNAGMDYRYPPGAVRRLDDALLYIFGQRYMNLSGNSERRSALEVRSKRLRDGMGDRGRE
ncbi:MAG: DUF429 domain-containing protein [Ornithinimicrobium sp.]